MNYIKLIRWPNLLIIAATMLLVRYTIIWPHLHIVGSEAMVPLHIFMVLVLASVFTAASGYVINDLFDTDVDSANKPNKVLIGKEMRFSTARQFYWILVAVTILMAAYLGFAVQSWRLSVVIVMMVGLLWFYSKRYKRMNLVGNLVIAAASSLSLVIVWLTDFFYLTGKPQLFAEASALFPKITGTLFVYTMFSFLTSMMREMVKDIEDVEGDARYGCRTFPVVAGVDSAKMMTMGLNVILLIMIGVWQYVLWQINNYYAFSYLFIVDIIALTTLYQIYIAKEKSNYSRISFLIKVLMVSGLASMAFL